ncbi:uncharacterized protein LOC109948147 [Prunus persica]|uniref:uncharacterized protein LOC109948147 n=1 Tax=Prunus persica TaxID=3760 RepID=UPI0009AB2AF7|nr:uncharacterized protein LOC109948147 [Prunus persica]
MAYHICLNASLKRTRYLLRQGLSFRGHDESSTSSKKVNYLELLQFLADHDKKVNALVLENAPGNLKLIAPSIKKDLGNACAKECISLIMSDLKDRYFSIIVDEARDVSIKEQMTIMYHLHVSICGECNPNDSSSEAFKLWREIQSFEFVFHLFFMKAILGITNTLSQALQKKDQDIVNAMGLVQTCNENLQVMRNNEFDELVDQASLFCNKHHIMIPNMDEEYVILGRSRRNAPIRTNNHHYRVELFLHVIDGQLAKLNDRFNAVNTELLTCLACLSPNLFFMKAILGITNTLSQALQKKDQDIVNAMSLVQTCNENLQVMRNNEFDELVDQASLFCNKHHIMIPNMDEEYVILGRSRRNAPIKTNNHHYRVELFLHVIDGQLAKLNDRFNAVNTELLTCLACLSPNNSFVAFNK